MSSKIKKQKKGDNSLYCPVSKTSSTNKSWYSISFGIGKQGRKRQYDNVSKFASIMLNQPECKEIMEPLHELKQYKNKKDKPFRLSFNFHPWYRQQNDGMLKWIDCNKAFGEYFDELYFRLTISVGIPDESFLELFKVIKYNSLCNKLSLIHLDLFSAHTYYEIINKCLTNYILTINHIEYEENKDNEFSKLTLHLKDYFNYRHDLDIQVAVQRLIDFNRYLSNATVVRDLHCNFSVTDVIKYINNQTKQYDFMAAFFDSLCINPHILSLNIWFGNVWWSSMEDDISALHQIFTTMWNGFCKFVSNRKLIKNYLNSNKYVSHDFDELKINDIYPLVPIIIDIQIPKNELRFPEDAYKTLRDPDNIAKFFDNIGANKDVVVYKLRLNEITFNENCLQSLLKNIFAEKKSSDNDNILKELFLIGKDHSQGGICMKSFAALIEYIANKKNNVNNLDSLSLGVFDMKNKDMQSELLNLIKYARVAKIYIEFEDLYFDECKIYLATYFEALYNVINAAKVTIEGLRSLSVPTEIISLIVNYSKYDGFDLRIKQPVKVITQSGGVRYEHDWKDMEKYKDGFKTICQENVDKLLKYFDTVIDDNNDVYSDFDKNDKSNRWFSSKWRNHMKLIFNDRTDVHVQNFGLSWEI